jgi:purine-nucleoside phosphorylase
MSADRAPGGGLLPRLTEAAQLIRSRTSLQPRIGLVLGSGLGAFARGLERATIIPYAQIPHFPTTGAVGHQGELVIGHVSGVPVAVMSGRAHHYEGYSFQQIAFPVQVLGVLGVTTLIVTNAAGSVNVNFKPGELMIIVDHINLMGGNPMIGPNEDQLGPRFFDMTEPYDAELREIAERACWKAGVACRKGVYIAFTGPSYETPAEIRMARALGADAVGMSTVPEVIAARHQGIRCLGLSCITNMAAGVLKKKLDHREVLEIAHQVKSALADALSRIIAEAAQRA